MSAGQFLVSVAVVVQLSAGATGQTTIRVSVDSAGMQAPSTSDHPAISGDGELVAFLSEASLVPEDTNAYGDVYVHALSSGAVVLVSVGLDGFTGVGGSESPALSSDGAILVFASYRTDLVAGDFNGVGDCFLRDLVTGTTERISVASDGSEGNARSWNPRCSAAGRFVVFQTYASNFVPGDANSESDVYLRDRLAGTTVRLSVGPNGEDADNWTGFADISADGRWVAFDGIATNLVAGDVNGLQDAFVRDVVLGTTSLVSITSAGEQASGGVSGQVAVSGDGSVVGFVSGADNLVPNDGNGTMDVFVRDLVAGVTERASVATDGTEGNDSSHTVRRFTISHDGRFVQFGSYATNLVPDDTNGVADIFVHDRALNTTERVSVASSGAESNGESLWGAISEDGQHIAFSSTADNLVGDDTNGTMDVFVHETCSVDASWANYGEGFPGTLGIPTLTSRSEPVIGSEVVLDLGNSSNSYTVALFLLGFARASIPTGWGGELLLQPSFAVLLALGPSGVSIAEDLPNDPSLCGFVIEAQALEVDAGAASGVSFTPGLELVFGI